MGFTLESADLYLAPYLREDRKAGFLTALQEFPAVKSLYRHLDDPHPLQGDCWASVPIIRVEDGQRGSIQGIVISNSCDISPDNQRRFPVRINFVGLISFDRYEAALRASPGAVAGKQSIADHLADVRGQRVSSLFFVPKTGSLSGDCIAVLDDVHTVPLTYFDQVTDRRRVFSLSDVGFWLFLFKLAYHYCRFHENVDRSPAPGSQSS